MSVDLISVFVSSNDSIDEFAGQLEDLLSIKFKLQDIEQLRLNPEYYSYVFRDPIFKSWFGVVSPLIEPYEDDNDKHFSNYNYWIEVGAFGTNNANEREKITWDFSRLIFDKLKSTNRYPLMMV